MKNCLWGYALIAITLTNTFITFPSTAQHGPTNEAQIGRWTLKVHGYSSRQRTRNIWNMTTSIPDTVTIISLQTHSGGRGRATFGFLIARDFELTKHLGIQAGLGIRQKGFRSESKYLIDRGYAVNLPDGKTEDNLFTYASSELSLQWKTLPKNRKTYYIRSGQRLDYLLKFRSAFWTNNYSNFKQFDYSVFGAVGLEYALNSKLLANRVFKRNQLYEQKSTFFIEIEGTPLMFNIHKSSWSNPYMTTVDFEGKLSMPNRYGPIYAVVRNTGFGVVTGIRF
jgi:hypothetical protein